MLAAVSAAQEPLLEAFSGTPSATELRRRLGTLPSAELTNLFRLAVEGRLALAGEGACLPLDAAQHAAVRDALALHPRRELVPFLEDLARRSLETRERLEAHRILEAMGAAEHLRLLLRLSAVPGEEAPALELRTSFTAAAAAIFAREPQALAEVQVLLGECPPALGAPLIEALARVRGARATEALARLLGRVPGLDGLLLCRLAQRGRFSARNEEFVFEALRRYLGHADPSLVAGAARATAALGDEAAVAELIELIEHRDPRARSSAFEALTALSGLALGEDASRWTSWYQAEAAWWEREADARLVRIERAHGQEYVRAAREVLEHRLFRDRSAEAFVHALGRRDAHEVWIACRALRELGSPLAVPPLVELLRADDPRVREAALEALRAITGLELDPSPESWESVEP